jgi:N-acetylglucosamine-6-phosphate deacetylase
MNQQSTHRPLLLQNASIVLPDRILNSGSLLVQGQAIEKIYEADASNIPEQCLVIDLFDCRLLPGFIDLHIHGAAGVDTMTASATQLYEVSRFLAARGVTAWLPTLVPGSLEEYTNAIRAIDQVISGGANLAARVLGVHYEGPFVNLAQCGALHREHFRNYNHPSDLSELPVLTTPSARMMTTLAPEIEGGIELIQQLERLGWIVSIGHTRADIDTLDRAFAAGARHMTHFMNAMSPLHHREPGPIGWGLSRDDVTCDIIADGIHLDPYVLKLLLKVKGSQGLNLISDAIAATGQGDGDYQIWGETITVKDGRTSNSHGSIAGSVITMLDAVRLLRSLGVSDVELSRMTSLNPARLLKVDPECGSIEEGKRADLVVIDARGNVQATVVGGEIVVMN